MYNPRPAHNAALPFEWVPTQGNNIPQHAVPVRGGPNGQLYVARGFVEGEMQIGTTSPSYTGGARLQDKHGRNRPAPHYEVLTCPSSLQFQLKPRIMSQNIPPRTSVPPAMAAIPKDGYGNEPPPYTGPGDDWVEVPKYLPPDPKSRESVQLRHLAGSKCLVLIDDSPSMQFLWAQTRAILAGIVDILSVEDKWEGLDVRFLHHTAARPCVKTREEFECVFNSVTTWRGERTMAEKVSKMFDESIQCIIGAKPPRPVVLLIFTDGIATDHAQLSDNMIHFSQKLNEKGVAKHVFRTHILQMGEDRKAVKPLQDFYDRVAQRDPERRILNVVSYHRGRRPLNGQYIVKLLLASTYIPVEEEPDFNKRPTPEVIEAQHRSLESIRLIGERM